VWASDLPLLALEDPTSDARAQISDEIEIAKCEDRCEAIVLGCADVANLAADLSALHGPPVLNGVARAVKLLDNLVGLGLRTSKLGEYAPLPKSYSGRSVTVGFDG
jgi:allantoin racemase